MRSSLTPIKGYIDISSRDRVNPVNSSTFNFDYSLINNIECDKIGVEHVIIEKGFYNIHLNNRVVAFTYNAVDFEVTLDMNDYSASGLAAELTNKFSTATGAVITFAIDFLGHGTLTILVGNTISITTSSNIDVWYMQGYHPSSPVVALGPISTIFVSLATSTPFYTKSVYVEVNGLINTSSYVRRENRSNVLSIVPNLSPFGSVLAEQDFGEKVFDAVRNVNTISVAVRDDRGRIIDNNGYDITITLYYY